MASVCVRARGVGRVCQAATHAGLLTHKLLVGLIGELEGLGVCGVAHILCTKQCQQSCVYCTCFCSFVNGSLHMAYPNGCRHNVAFLLRLRPYPMRGHELLRQALMLMFNERCWSMSEMQQAVSSCRVHNNARHLH